MKRRPVMLIAVALLAVSGCNSGPEKRNSDDSARTEHRDGDGPLAASMGPGESSIAAPRKQTNWVGTFGSAILCTQTDLPVTLESIRYELEVPPESVATYIRSGNSSVEESDAIAGPVITAYGEPLAFSEGPSRVGGNLREGIRGERVDQSCDRRSKSAEFTEILTAFSVGTAGAWSKSFVINYRSGGKRYALKVEWAFVACGSRVIESRLC